MSQESNNTAGDLREFMLKKASHELRAPLAAIASILQAVTEDASEISDEHRRMLHRARQRTNSLLALVDDLRRYWLLRGGQDTIARQRQDMDRIVASTLDLFRARADSAGLTLSCRCEPCAVSGDQELLRELVTNLLANAIQYTPRDGRIEVTLLPQDGMARLQVSDTGIGISDEAAARLFEEFYRSNEARAMFPEGTGMGLNIVKRIVDFHGGRIEAGACKGGGTVFTVQLPLA